MNQLGAVLVLISLLILTEKANGSPEWVHQTGTDIGSPWLMKVTNHPRPRGCWSRPWICPEGPFSPGARMRCCRGQCVDVALDMNHCGLCGIRCPFSWQCCRGLCVNTNVSRFNCGRCGNRCPWGDHCTYGLCGYAASSPPWPCPPHRPPPCKPHPPQPPSPYRL